MFSTIRARKTLYYLATVIASIMALLLQVEIEQLSVRFPALQPFFGDLPRYLFFIPVVFMAAILVDAWAGVLATMTWSLLAVYWVLPTGGLFKVGQTAEVWDLIVFWVVAVTICVIAKLYHRNRLRLKESEVRFRSFMDNSPAIAWMKDAQGRYVYLSKTYENLTGARFEGWRGRADTEVWPENIVSLFRKHDLSVLTTNQPLQAIESSRKPDGTAVTLLVTKFPFETANGERFVGGVGMDITDRNKAEEVRQHLSAIVESSYDAIIGKTLDGTITSWNPGAERLYGYSTAEMLGQSITVLVPRDSPNEIADILRKVANREHIADYETVRSRKDGSLVEVSLRVSPILDTSGNIVGAATIAHDISERKVLQEALLRSEKLAVTGRLAATIAHEVNNPLGAAMNAVYLARVKPTQGNEMLEIAERELRRAAHITQQTLGFYRDSGNQEKVTAHDVIKEVLSVYATKLRNRNITVHYRRRCSSSSPREGCPDGCTQCQKYLCVNAGELRQVISNLLANGIDALSDGGTMYIRTSRSSDKVQLTIADNGYGIRTENLKRVFEPFFTTKRDFGTGLGLWVTQELVRKHNGLINVRSSKGKGTVFRLTFPQKRSEDGVLLTASSTSSTRAA